ncbi:MAG: addiction module protein [Cyclobacteriaceae bacterium]
MSATEIREELHQLIDQADDRLVNLMYAMIHADLTEQDYQMSSAHKEILDQRISAHEREPASGSNWEEAKARIENQL